MDSYLLSENLLFYTSHVFKRAFWGTFVVKILGVKDYQLFLAVNYGAILAILIFYFLWVNKNKLLTILYFSSPIGLLFYIADKRAFARKEMLFFPLILFVTYILKSRTHQILKLTITIISSVIMILIHDSFIFLVLPLFVYYLIKEKFRISIILIYVLFSVCFAVLIVKIGIVNADFDVLDNFFNSAKIDWHFTHSWLLKNFQTTVTDSWNHLFLFNFLVFFFLYLFHMAVLRYFFRNAFSENKLFFFMQAVSLVLISITAKDYGRWIAFAFFNSSLVISNYGSAMEAQHSGKNKLSGIVLIVLLFLLTSTPHYSFFSILDKDLYPQFLNHAMLHFCDKVF